ncbi:hypothetical protein ACJMK2_018175 [Sinanodonta woodiana]|uniref:Band 7 domain-containing protein n=1 Tax=Sinanodonta woodiana TaxID=1069815 RepID=A0ABD3UCL6_SINWO
MIGHVTLDVGEQALVYDLHGSARIEDGPKRLFLWREKLVMLARHSANQNEYLVVRHKDGRVEHVKGPCVLYKNPIAHLSVEKKEMISLDANEALVVYRTDVKTMDVKRYVQYGPTLFMPVSNEWLHEFCWHGTDPSNKTRMIPNKNKFERLKIIPDQFYYNVDEVRTGDDALIRVKLMIFFELKDIETMLNGTKDPYADFVNCVCADVVAFAAKYSYVEFIEHSGELNLLSSYPQLMERSKQIGYEVSKVVFRGYYAHEKLQKLHDGAIETRTKLKIAYEKEEQEQLLTDLKLQNEKDRIELEQRIEIENMEHSMKMQRSQVQHSLELELMAEMKAQIQWQKDKEGELQGKVAEDEQKLKHFQKLHGLGVNLDEYFHAQLSKPSKIVNIVVDKDAANFHLHHS